MKTLIVYIHLIAACIAVGVIFMQDLALAKTRGTSLPLTAINELIQSANIISNSLKVLWVSGLILVAMGYLDNPAEYLKNQKLWAKFSVVTILTVNGIFLHNFSFPRVVSSRGVLGLHFLEKNLVVITGVVSSVSWLFACYLGIARPWNHTVQYTFVMSIYLSLLGFSCLVGCAIIHCFADYNDSSIRQKISSRRNPIIQNSGAQTISNSTPLAERISKM